mmetsp:Transcript_50193/g.155071  ORF Transcript_50193/g.155071 Transcript_50193/m.155071 type:complete len:538 (-) Transcript_50193:1862-3475(-)
MGVLLLLAERLWHARGRRGRPGACTTGGSGRTRPAAERQRAALLRLRDTGLVRLLHVLLLAAQGDEQDRVQQDAAEQQAGGGAGGARDVFVVIHDVPFQQRQTRREEALVRRLAVLRAREGRRIVAGAVGVEAGALEHALDGARGPGVVLHQVGPQVEQLVRPVPVLVRRRLRRAAGGVAVDGALRGDVAHVDGEGGLDLELLTDFDHENEHEEQDAEGENQKDLVDHEHALRTRHDGPEAEEGQQVQDNSDDDADREENLPKGVGARVVVPAEANGDDGGDEEEHRREHHHAADQGDDARVLRLEDGARLLVRVVRARRGGVRPQKQEEDREARKTDQHPIVVCRQGAFDVERTLVRPVRELHIAHELAPVRVAVLPLAEAVRALQVGDVTADDGVAVAGGERHVAGRLERRHVGGHVQAERRVLVRLGLQRGERGADDGVVGRVDDVDAERHDRVLRVLGEVRPVEPDAVVAVLRVQERQVRAVVVGGGDGVAAGEVRGEVEHYLPVLREDVVAGRRRGSVEGVRPRGDHRDDIA